MINLEHNKVSFVSTFTFMNQTIIRSTQAQNKVTYKSKVKFKSIYFKYISLEELYTFQLSFNLVEGSIIPARLSILVELEDSNGNTQKVESVVKFDSSSGFYFISQAIKQDKNFKYSYNGAVLRSHLANGKVEIWVSKPPEKETMLKNYNKSLGKKVDIVSVKPAFGWIIF